MHKEAATNLGYLVSSMDNSQVSPEKFVPHQSAIQSLYVPESTELNDLLFRTKNVLAIPEM